MGKKIVFCIKTELNKTQWYSRHKNNNNSQDFNLSTKVWYSGAVWVDIIHLLLSLEGDMKICPTQKIHVARGTNLHVSRLTGQLIFIIPKGEARRYTAQSVVPWDTTGNHDVWRETRRFVFPPGDFSRPIIFLYSSCQLYEV